LLIVVYLGEEYGISSQSNSFMAQTSRSSASNGRPAQRMVTPSPRGTGQLSGVQVMFAVILAVGLLLAINFSSRIADGQELLNAYDNVSTEIQHLKLEYATLSAQSTFVQSDQYIEEWARERGKMIRSGERIVIPVPMGTPQTPTAVPENVDDSFEGGLPNPEPWELWWSLFFDTAPPVIETS
jgi:cell division protein FtsB